MNRKKAGLPLRGPLSKEQEAQYREETSNHILRYSWIMLALIACIQLFNIAHALIYTDFSLSTLPSRVYTVLYSLMLAVSCGGIILTPFLRRRMPRSTNTVMTLQFLYGSFLVLWGAAVTAYDQRKSENINVYLIVALTVAMLVYLKPLQSVLLYGAAQVMLTAAIPFFQPGPTGNFGIFLNLIVVNLMSIFISCYRWDYGRVRFKDHQIILQQNEDIRQHNELLNHLASHDALTNIQNRRYLSTGLPDFCESCITEGKNLAFLMVDIDNFKRFNDQFGHQKGDECLQKVAAALSEPLGEEDTLIRYGGEEFLIVSKGLAQPDVQKMGEALRQAVEALRLPNPIPEEKGFLTISIGAAASLPSNTLSCEKLLQQADNALYLAKSRGKNQTVCSWNEEV